MANQSGVFDQRPANTRSFGLMLNNQLRGYSLVGLTGFEPATT